MADNDGLNLSGLMMKAKEAKAVAAKDKAQEPTSNNIEVPAVPKTKADEGENSAQQARVLPDEQQLTDRGVKPGDGLAVPSPEIGHPKEPSSSKDLSRPGPGNLSDLMRQQVERVGQDLKRAGVHLDQKTLSSEQEAAHDHKTPDRTPEQGRSHDHGRSR